MVRRRAGCFGAVSFLLLSGLMAGCATPVARSMVIVPGPRDQAVAHVPEFSRAAAERVRAEIETRGFAAIMRGSTARPESLVVAERPDGNSDLILFVWVRQVDVGNLESAEDVVAHGGLDLRDRSGRRLAYSSGPLTEPGRPASELHEVAAPENPIALAAAGDFGELALSASRDFSKKVGPRFG